MQKGLRQYAGRDASSPTAEFIFFNGKRAARLDLPGAVVHYYFSDHLGSASVVTSATGTIQDESDYYPFGGERVISSATGNRYKFTGKERDLESNLDFFGARYYGSTMGRFLNPDPVFFQASMLADPQRFNEYAYVRNNPLILIDPKGEAIELTGDEEQRRKQLEAIKNAVGEKGAAYLYENKVATTDENGNKVTKSYVGIYTNGPDANGPLFNEINPAAAAIGAITQSTEVVRAAVVPNGTILTDDRGGAVIIGPLGTNSLVPTSPGATFRSGGILNVAILDPSTNPGTIDSRKMSDSKPGTVDQGIMMGHELGHAGYAMGVLIPGPSRKAAVDLENHVRKAKNPNAPTRKEH